MRESDLYAPVKDFLDGQGYEVKGEVLDCDVLAVRGDEDPVVVELKLSLNLGVVLQAVERLAVTEKVYVGVPRGASVMKRRRRAVQRLFRRLGLGLLVIDVQAPVGAVDVVLDPGDYRPRISRRRRERLLGEFLQRVGDPNAGGSDRRSGVMTAYRQRALRIGRHLADAGPTKASEVAEALGEPKARDILYRNVYGWFERAAVGIYDLTPRGRTEIRDWE